MNRHVWLEWEKEFLRLNYADNRTDVLAEVLGRPVHKVHAAAQRMGLKKSDAWLSGEDAGRLRHGGEVGAMTRFQKGHTTWSKGTKGLAGQHPNSRANQFKPGRLAQEAHNYLPIGSHRIRADGYLERKVTDDPSLYPARRWVSVHRLVWEEAHGPIPEGHVVCFRPGRRTTELERITLDALELITNAELGRRNSIHRLPPELADLARLRGRLTRAINERDKHEQEHR